MPVRALAVFLTVMLAACDRDPRGVSPSASLPGSSSVEGWTIAPSGDLNAFFDCLDEAGIAIVSAHRGGPASGWPENGLETMRATLAATPALMEIDVAASADGVLFLMHDNELDRTTTGSGYADRAQWKDVASLRLEDKNGKKTPFSPPKFSDVLAWAKSRTIVQVDFKRSARYEDVIDEIYRQGAEDRVILIAYSMASAQKLHRLAPDIMISLSVESQSELNRVVAAGVPADRLLGFTGTRAPRPRLFSLLDDRNIEVIFGTLGGRDSIDNDIAATSDEARYAQIAAAGADIIATDRPRAAHAALEKAGRAVNSGACGVSYTPAP